MNASQHGGEERGARVVTELAARELVNSWDLFDTLLARFYPDPKAALRVVDAKFAQQGFLERRLGAQAALDRIGAPYVLHDIYRQMVADGLSESLASQLLVEELKVEQHLMYPIRAAVERVADEDLVVSDMYLSEQHLSDLVWKICGLRSLRPVVRSNWGKAAGTIWPEILRHYVIRRHVGDDLRSDVEIPRRYGIETEHATGARPTEWERKIAGLGQQHLALILREARLRALKHDAGPICRLVAGPYLTLLFAFSVWVHESVRGSGIRFAFLRRDCEDLARVFSALFPVADVRQIDLTRRIAHADDADLDAVLSSQIVPGTLLVDMVATGRSAFRFIDRSGAQISRFAVLIFLDNLLMPDEAQARSLDLSSGRFCFATRKTDLPGHHYRLECLTQTVYPPVVSLGTDLRSGGVVRGHAKSDLSAAETRLIGQKSELLQEFMNAVQRRGVVPCDVATANVLIRHSLDEILGAGEIAQSFPSFLARERNV